MKLVKTTTPKKLVKQTSVDGPISRGESQSIGSGLKTVTVTFTTALADAEYVVSAGALGNVTDSAPDTIVPIKTAQSKTAFTFSWNTPTDTANYTLDWVLVRKNSP